MRLHCMVEGSADAAGGGAAWRAPEVSVAGRISVDDVDTVSEGAALSVQFHNLCLELYGSGMGLSGVQVASLRAAVDLRANQGLLGYLNSVRGFVHKSSGARIALYLDLGGMTQTVEFPYGQEMLYTENFHRDLFSLERGEAGEDGRERRVTPPYVATLLVSVQRRTEEDRAIVGIDSLEVSAVIA